MTRVWLGAVCAAVGLGLAPVPVPAQDLFSPAIVVNDQAVTGWEIDQRRRLLAAFNTPGDLDRIARTQLVEDRLRQQELDRVGLSLPPEGLARALEDFAARAGTTLPEFEARLASQGVAPETLRDFVAVSATWRDYIRARFAARVEVTEADIDQRLAQEQTQAAGLEVNLAEIIMPSPPERPDISNQTQALARQFATIRSEAAFEAAAREYSAVPSREQGGRLGWQPLSQYPAALQNLFLTLSPGETTPPLQLTGAVAVIQFRGLREGAVPAAEPTEIDYAVLRIPGGLSPEALAEAQRIAARTDTCDDLYGLRLPADRLLRETRAPAAIPSDIALALASLDRNEATWGLTADGGATLLFVMLCARTYPLPEGAPDRETVANVIRGERLQSQADAILAGLRAQAVIVGE
ncbi:peptidylprolyl isomerase [Rubellimicrobium sp. CFH 75288]|uniref:peptidylprolyl isomerase n=1 Tax=Rubellimicrobium sp. CFH 75288 TaxID=2697034 RepID=UPI001411DCF4|nr:peptidylprolyl isomerase [Rubellimicrobium sp. CFH 75288]NAZ35411.1 peptidylprolyl isomerase [Rubellimicrobium sp. CFH 75288]